MAITNFISTVWSENLYKQLDAKYIGVANCTREWEGDIRRKGDRVKICGVGPVSVFDYTKNTNMSAPTALSDTSRELIITEAKAFNFQIDDIDRAQSTPRIMDEALRNAANALVNIAEAHVYSHYQTVPTANKISVNDPTPEDITDSILQAIVKLQKNGICDDVVLEVTPDVGAIILKAKLDLATDNSAILENGCIGSFAGCKVFVSNNVSSFTEGGSLHHMCYLRTKRAIAFAEQLSEIEAYRPELRFADAVKGLMLYGSKVVYPNELYVLDVAISA